MTTPAYRQALEHDEFVANYAIVGHAACKELFRSKKRRKARASKAVEEGAR